MTELLLPALVVASRSLPGATNDVRCRLLVGIDARLAEILAEARGGVQYHRQQRAFFNRSAGCAFSASSNRGPSFQLPLQLQFAPPPARG